VQRMEGDVIMLQDLFTFRIDAITADRKVMGELRSCGLRPSFEGKFTKHGIDLPAELFGPQTLSEVMAR
jgi:pilus assembly protein CpaF